MFIRSRIHVNIWSYKYQTQLTPKMVQEHCVVPVGMNIKLKMDVSIFMPPNFEKVEGAYWFGLVPESVRYKFKIGYVVGAPRSLRTRHIQI